MNLVNLENLSKAELLAEIAKRDKAEADALDAKRKERDKFRGVK